MKETKRRWPSAAAWLGFAAGVLFYWFVQETFLGGKNLVELLGYYGLLIPMGLFLGLGIYYSVRERRGP